MKQINDTLKTIKDFDYFDKIQKAIEHRDTLVSGKGPYEDIKNILEGLREELKKHERKTK